MKRYVRATVVSNYVDEDILHNWMSHDKHFGDFDYYNQLPNMVIQTSDPQGMPGDQKLTVRRYWKFNKIEDGIWEVYEIDKNGKKIGEPFELFEY